MNMTLQILYADEKGNWPIWSDPIASALDAAGLRADLFATTNHPEKVDYVIYAPSSGLSDFTPFTQLKAVLSLWAGVDQIVANQTITCPITRMSDDGLKEGMVEYVTGHVLHHHLGLDTDLGATTWVKRPAPPLARHRTVGILGFGALGRACGQALAQLGFGVLGWTRSARSDPEFEVMHGDDGLSRIMAMADHLVLLLPDTPQTKGVVRDQTIATMKPGVHIINAGRGPSVNEADLIAGIDRGVIAHATLDVFETESLADEHPFWSHAQVTVTPHIAAETRPETAAALIAQNIRRHEAGQDMAYVVDRAAGY